VYESLSRAEEEMEHEGRPIDVVYGVNGDESEIQSLRYDPELWSAEDAGAHCRIQQGAFEPAEEESDDPENTESPDKPDSSDRPDSSDKPDDKSAKPLMKVTVKAIGLSRKIRPDEKSVRKLVRDIDKQAAKKIQSAGNDGESARKELDRIKKIVGEKNTTEAVKSLRKQAEEAQSLHRMFVEDTLRMGRLAGIVKPEKAAEKEAFLAGLPPDQLDRIRGEYRDAVDAKFTVVEQLPPNTQDMNPNKMKNKTAWVEPVPDTSFTLD
jgi:hypothetical protein